MPLLIHCPCCDQPAATDGKYHKEVLGRTIPPPDPNGFQKACSRCAKLLTSICDDDHKVDAEGLPEWVHNDSEHVMRGRQ